MLFIGTCFDFKSAIISNKELINLKIIAGEVDLKGDALDLMSYPVYKENEAAGNYTVQLPPAGLGAGMHYVFNTTHKDQALRQLINTPDFIKAAAARAVLSPASSNPSRRTSALPERRLGNS